MPVTVNTRRAPWRVAHVWYGAGRPWLIRQQVDLDRKENGSGRGLEAARGRPEQNVASAKASRITESIQILALGMLLQANAPGGAVKVELEIDKPVPLGNR